MQTGTLTHSLPSNPFNFERHIGTVAEIGHGSVVTALHPVPVSSESDESLIVGDIGSFILVACREYAIFGQITKIERADLDEESLFATVKLQATIEVRTGSITAGTLTTPRIGQKVFLAHPKLVQWVVEAQGGRTAEERPISLSLANLTDAKETPVGFTPEMIFGRHLAVVGSTGAGKSWTLARLMEETSKYKSKVVLFDATGEFNSLEAATKHVHLGNHPSPSPESMEVALPYFQLTERDLFSIFKPHGQSQGPKLRMAIRSLKLAWLDTSIAPDGTIVKANKSKLQFEQAMREHRRELEAPDAKFDVRKLVRQIQNECVHDQRSELEPTVWGDYNGVDRAYCIPLVNRIHDILRSPSLESIFNPDGKHSLLLELERFLESPDEKIFRISLEHLSFAHNAREIVANAIGRHMLNLARDGRFREHPLLVIVDEAHQFLNQSLTAESEQHPLDSFAIIAKEGRKYALNICLATQRPRDIPEDVLSQMGTLIVHRLINHQDRAVIERASTEMDSASMQSLPALAPGRAIILGVDFPIPLEVKVRAPRSAPASDGPDYQRFWR
ncbi:MAG: ATP-binding protein [Bdellovibrionales bacterium]|nr:ATP-binding protein [Bdellovibrionales bacterium]